MTDDERDELRETFDHFDRDGNGRIDRREFGGLLQALDADASDEEADIGFNEIDADKNGTVELHEFIAWWTER